MMKRGFENYLFNDYYLKSCIEMRNPSLRTTGSNIALLLFL